MIRSFLNSGAVKRPIYYILKLVPDRALERFIVMILLAKTEYHSSADALRFLLEVEAGLYRLLGKHAIRYGKGRHVKQRLTRYVEYFSEEALKNRGPYLDVGCSSGYLAREIAKRTNEAVVGIDKSSRAISIAKGGAQLTNLRFICGDATSMALTEEFGTIIVSNVLEHIKDRVGFLRQLREKIRPTCLLIRVPNFQRDWRVPLRKELGITYFGDPTHYIEHSPDELEAELNQAGFKIIKEKILWGEIWISATSTYA
jgi:2-polyprenyl-3-methyl-5-hydroxy-6-metoxy-1,4-benzoquinol methylase